MFSSKSSELSSGTTLVSGSECKIILSILKYILDATGSQVPSHEYKSI